MDLYLLNDVRVDAANTELLKDLDQLKSTIDDARPLDKSVVSRLRNELTGDQVHNSNAIEGNTLTLRETRAVLESGQFVDVGRKREHQEAINLGRAIESVQSTIGGKVRYADQEFFCEVHRLLMSGIQDDWAGVYRRDRVTIAGAKYQPPGDFDAHLNRLFAELSAIGSHHPAVRAAWAHWGIARIHPFRDGNGRMSRLWQDYILLASNYTPAIIPQSQRKVYYDSLQAADEGDFTQLVQLVIQSAISTSQTYVNAIREADDVGTWADALIGESDQLADERRRLEYSRWRSRIVELRDAFLRCLTMLNRKSTELDFDLHNIEIVDMATWESLKSESHVPQTWCFKIVARSDSAKFEYVFFVGRHFASDDDDVIGLAGRHVTLLISEKSGAGERELLRNGNSPITLREILVVGNELVRRRWDASVGALVYDRATTSVQIAQDFLAEVVRHRLT